MGPVSLYYKSSEQFIPTTAESSSYTPAFIAQLRAAVMVPSRFEQQI